MPFRSVLVVDDEEPLRQLLTLILRDRGYPARTVASGEDALKELAAREYDLVLTDVMLPGMSGVEAAARIGRRAHLVFVTAYDQYAVQAFAQGALDYLVKPVEPARLADTVARLKERQQPAGTARRWRGDGPAGDFLGNFPQVRNECLTIFPHQSTHGALPRRVSSGRRFRRRNEQAGSWASS